MKKDILTIKNDNGLEFNIVVVYKGDMYGLNNSLKYDKDIPLIEFYDTCQV